MSDQDRIRQKAEEKLASTVSKIVEQSRAADREEVDRLLRARSISFGIGMLVLGAGMIGIAAFFNRHYPKDAAIILLFVLAMWIIAAVFIDYPNWLRVRLVRRLLKRSQGR